MKISTKFLDWCNARKFYLLVLILIASGLIFLVNLNSSKSEFMFFEFNHGDGTSPACLVQGDLYNQIKDTINKKPDIISYEVVRLRTGKNIYYQNQIYMFDDYHLFLKLKGKDLMWKIDENFGKKLINLLSERIAVRSN